MLAFYTRSRVGLVAEQTQASVEDDDDDDDDDDDNDDDDDEGLHAIREHGRSICTATYLNIYIYVRIRSVGADENSINTDYYRPCHVVYAHEHPRPRIFVLGQKLIELMPIYIYSSFFFPRQENMIHRLISIDMQGYVYFEEFCCVR